MSITITKSNIFAAGGKRFAIASIALDAELYDDGIPVVPADFSLSTIESVLFAKPTAAGLLALYDGEGKIRLLNPTAAHGHEILFQIAEEHVHYLDVLMAALQGTLKQVFWKQAVDPTKGTLVFEGITGGGAADTSEIGGDLMPSHKHSVACVPDEQPGDFYVSWNPTEEKFLFYDDSSVEPNGVLDTSESNIQGVLPHLHTIPCLRSDTVQGDSYLVYWDDTGKQFYFVDALEVIGDDETTTSIQPPGIDAVAEESAPAAATEVAGEVSLILNLVVVGT